MYSQYEASDQNFRIFTEIDLSPRNILQCTATQTDDAQRLAISTIANANKKQLNDIIHNTTTNLVIIFKNKAKSQFSDPKYIATDTTVKQP